MTSTLSGKTASAGTVRFIGLVEFAGALGLILPAATGIATVLTSPP
jgi:hypothetical protein